jgi:hypothetical protein
MNSKLNMILDSRDLIEKQRTTLHHVNMKV